MSLEKLDAILDRYDRNPAQLIPILQDVQAEENYLPREALEAISEKLDIPLVRLYSVATFYKAFSLKPRGKHIVQVCMGTACHVRGAPRILDKMVRDFGIQPGGTTKDMEFTLETVNCLGACALGPIVVVDGEYHGQMTTPKWDKLYKTLKKAEG
ncbi:MAG: NAD(P)H-dependent oxidoreductase subunit E [Deltaproteobacteria bacterium]|nr:MAG: NAD(P)H-dependent oxidoreductase subunit E [Deltaproteobacteria bacterium]